MDDEDWNDDYDEPLDDEAPLPCPECGADVYADAEACPACGYWITDADRTAAWRAGSATGHVRRIGLWVLGIALLGWLVLRFS